MLQWMGGSRKKIATSRKSIQKRQKQYFEQRRRQQQKQNAGFDMYGEEGSSANVQSSREHRSLDILSLLNLPSGCHDGKPARCTGKEDGCGSVSTVGCAKRMDPSLSPANRVPLVDSFEGPYSSVCQVKTVSPEMDVNTIKDEINLRLSSQDVCSNAFCKVDGRSEVLETTHQQLSVLDLIVGDGTNKNLEGNPTQEAHVTFSVEGLGKMGAETPLQSPQHPIRHATHGPSSSLKAIKSSNPSKSLNLMLDSFELEMDKMIEDIDLPLSGSSSLFPAGTDSSYGELKRSLSPLRDYMLWDGHNHKMRSLSNDDWNDERHDWDSSRNVDIIDKREPTKFQKSWLNPMFGDYADFWDSDDLSCTFEGPHLQKNRDTANPTEGFVIADLAGLKHRTSGLDYGCRIGEWTSDETNHPDWSSLMKKDARDTLSSVSEESCSSTAVRSKTEMMSLPKSLARQKSRDQKVFHGSEAKHESHILPKERHLSNINDVHKGNACGPVETWQVTLSKSRPAQMLSCSLQEQLGAPGDWLFEDGYKSSCTNFDHACQNSESSNPLSGSKPFPDDVSGERQVYEPFPARFLSNKLESDYSVEHSNPRTSTPGMFECNKISHDQHASIFSKFNLGVSQPDYCSDVELKSGHPQLSSDAASKGEKLNSNIFAEQSVGEHEKIKQEIEEAKYEGVRSGKASRKSMKAAHPQKSGCEFFEAIDGSLETSSSVRIPDNSDSSLHEEEYDHNGEVSLHDQNGNKVNASEGSGERKSLSKMNGSCLDKSPPLMIIGSSVVQLFCMQKVSQAFVLTPGKGKFSS